MPAVDMVVCKKVYPIMQNYPNHTFGCEDVITSTETGTIRAESSKNAGQYGKKFT